MLCHVVCSVIHVQACVQIYYTHPLFFSFRHPCFGVSQPATPCFLPRCMFAPYYEDHKVTLLGIRHLARQLAIGVWPGSWRSAFGPAVGDRRLAFGPAVGIWPGSRRLARRSAFGLTLGGRRLARHSAFGHQC